MIFDLSVGNGCPAFESLIVSINRVVLTDSQVERQPFPLALLSLAFQPTKRPIIPNPHPHPPHHLPFHFLRYTKGNHGREQRRWCRPKGVVELRIEESDEWGAEGERSEERNEEGGHCWMNVRRGKKREERRGGAGECLERRGPGSRRVVRDRRVGSPWSQNSSPSTARMFEEACDFVDRAMV